MACFKLASLTAEDLGTLSYLHLLLSSLLKLLCFCDELCSRCRRKESLLH